MLKLIGFIISICLVILIFLLIPQESVGLSSFASKIGSSPRSSGRFLNILTIFLILIYFGIAIKLNLSNI